MLLHDLRLALRSLARTPVLSMLMIGAIAVGIAAAMIAITLYHARAGQPIPWKSNTLYAVMLDTRAADVSPRYPQPHAEYPPFQLSYPDARALYASRIPVHAVMMYRAAQILTPARSGLQPFGVSARITTADFFATFDVPFLYGSGWSRAADDAPDAVVVLSRYLNQKLFGGADSVGAEVVLDGHAYQVVGVINAWAPQPRYYDLDGGAFELPEDVFLPFGWLQARRLMPNATVRCMVQKARSGTFFDQLLTQQCVWLQYWVELRGRADRDRFQSFVDSYTAEERRHGRFPRKNNNRIVDVATWLDMHDVVGDESRLQLVLGFVFLGVCVLNTLGLLLAKFLSAAPICGLRRALGARRIDIVRQHVVEVVILALLGGAAGVALTLAGLAVLERLLFLSALKSGNPYRVALAQSLVHMDTTVLLSALGLSLLTGLVAGLYPAYRVGRLDPASFLKAQ